MTETRAPYGTETPSGAWRTDEAIRDEHDRLATIYRQRGLSVLIETASDELVKLRRARLDQPEKEADIAPFVDDAAARALAPEMADFIRRLAECGDETAHHYRLSDGPRDEARALLARLDPDAKVIPHAGTLISRAEADRISKDGP